MKKYTIFLFIIISLIIACQDEMVKEIEDAGIIGKWQLVEHSFSIGDATQHWQTIENGYFLNFKNDGTFSSTRSSKCVGGFYSIDYNLLTLNFICNGQIRETVDYMQINNGDLCLSPRSPTVCIEGCSYKYKKRL